MKLNKTVLWALLFATGFEINTAQENSLPTFPSIRERQNSDGASINRYIVKFKDGSPELMTRMQQASDQNDFELLSTFANPNEQPFASGNFLPKDNAEVLYLNSEEEVKIWEENDDVEYVELGEFAASKNVILISFWSLNGTLMIDHFYPRTETSPRR